MTNRAGLLPPRIAREQKIVSAMIRMYCRDRHQIKTELCADCEELQYYTAQRLEHCPFKSCKPTCAKCTVHCYKPEMRDKIKTVMRYAGPRMLRRHPLMAIRHIIDGMKKGGDD